jgi:hypothetical protein
MPNEVLTEAEMRLESMLTDGVADRTRRIVSFLPRDKESALALLCSGVSILKDSLTEQEFLELATVVYRGL